MCNCSTNGKICFLFNLIFLPFPFYECKVKIN